MNNRKNLLSALLLQGITIVHGLVLPKLIIESFGSETNGLISSITQFLSFISLLEGGLGAVVLAELYKPINDGNDDRIRQILFACQSFFRKLAFVFIGYTLILSVVYPIVIPNNYNFHFTSTLVLILSISTLVQYLFSITNKLMLQAQHKIYIVNFVSSLAISLNLAATIVIIKLFPHIHVIKLASSAVFLMQPFVYSYFIEKKYKKGLKHTPASGDKPLKNRWDGFAQNLAHYINMNMPVVLITIFASLSEVSVYTVYMLAINALRTIITNVANSYQSALGKYLAEGNETQLNAKFNQFERISWAVGVVLFCTCLMLINPFVKLYTQGVTDANYYSPYFAIVIILANLLYCIREPYRLLILAAGKFRETNLGSFMEALINFIISLALVGPLGLLGIAIGTLCAVAYRFFYFIRFLKKDILFRSFRRYIGLIPGAVLVILVNVLAYWNVDLSINSLFSFAAHGVLVIAVEVLLYVGISAAISYFGKTAKRSSL